MRRGLVQQALFYTIVQCAVAAVVDLTCTPVGSITSCDNGYSIVACNVSANGTLVSGEHCSRDPLPLHQKHFTETWQFWFGLMGGLCLIGIIVAVCRFIQRENVQCCKSKAVSEEQTIDAKEKAEKDKEQTNQTHRIHSGRVTPSKPDLV